MNKFVPFLFCKQNEIFTQLKRNIDCLYYKYPLLLVEFITPQSI